MIDKNILLALIILFVFSGCVTGPSTYEVWKRNMDLQIGYRLYSGMKNRKKFYNEEYSIYPAEYPKRCKWGYLVKNNDPEMKIVGWKILSGKEYCKDRQAWALF